MCRFGRGAGAWVSGLADCGGAGEGGLLLLGLWLGMGLGLRGAGFGVGEFWLDGEGAGVDDPLLDDGFARDVWFGVGVVGVWVCGL